MNTPYLIVGYQSNGATMLADYFANFFNELDPLLSQSIAKYYQNVAQILLPIILVVLVAWTAWHGYLILSHQEKDLRNFGIRLVKFVVIFSLMFFWEDAYQLIIDPVLNGIPMMINEVTGTTGENPLFQFIDFLFFHVSKTIDTFGSLVLIGGSFLSMILAGAELLVGIVLIVTYFFIMLVSKIYIAILLIMTPLFLFFMAFEATRGFFKNWISSLAMPLLTLLIVNLTIALIGSLITSSLQKYFQGDSLAVEISAQCLGIVAGIIFILVIYEASTVASNLVSDGFNIKSITPDVGRATGNAIKNAIKTLMK